MPVALIGASLILLHSFIMIIKLIPVIGVLDGKALTGYFSIILMAMTLFAGYLRHKKSSGLRRKFHLFSAFTFSAMFLTHLFYPI